MASQGLKAGLAPAKLKQNKRRMCAGSVWHARLKSACLWAVW